MHPISLSLTHTQSFRKAVLTILDFTATPRISKLEEIDACATDVTATFNDAVRVVIDQAIRRVLVGSSRCCGTDNVVLLVPGHHLFEQFILCQLKVHAATTTHLGPLYPPHGVLRTVEWEKM